MLEPLEGKTEETLAFLREFYSFMLQKGYSRDILFHDSKQTGYYIHMRIWKSPESRMEAQHDPEVHKFWLKLPEYCTIVRIYEELQPVFSTYDSSAAAT